MMGAFFIGVAKPYKLLHAPALVEGFQARKDSGTTDVNVFPTTLNAEPLALV